MLGETEIVRDRGAVEPCGTSLRRAVRERLRDAAPALIAYTALRVVGVLVTAVLATQVDLGGRRRTLVYILGSWDGVWYRWVALHGYHLSAHSDPTVLHHSASFAWFPGYPALIDTLSWIPGMPAEAAGLIITLIAGLAAAWGVMRLGVELTGDRRTGVVFSSLWAIAPGSLALQMVYSEALFCALASWTLVALMRRRWLTAALLTAFAGTVRSSAVALVVAVAVAAGVDLVRRRRFEWRPVLAVVVSPAGLVGYWLFVALATGKSSGWFWVERNLTHMSFDWGADTVNQARTSLVSGSGAADLLITLVIAAALVLLIWTLAEPMPMYVRAYAVVILITALGTVPYFGGKPRFMLPAFVLALPIARRLAAEPTRILVPLFVVLAAASTWFGTYLMTVANFAP